MTIAEVVSLAQNGELKSIAVKNDLSAVIGFINLGLIELYKRFPLNIKEVIIDISDPLVTEYQLPTDFMWIVTAYGEVPSNSPVVRLKHLPINSEDDVYSINTIGWNTVQIPSSVPGNAVSIMYVAEPPVFTVNDTALDIPIPSQMIEALLNYIGYRGHGSIKGDIKAESNTHYRRFEASVARLIAEGMFNEESIEMKTKLGDRGFK